MKEMVTNHSQTVYIMEALKQFYRKFTHNRFSFLINISSLVPGLICSLLIFSWVLFQIDFDRFHSKIERIVLIRGCMDNSASHQNYPGCAPAVGPAIKQDFPEVEQFARISINDGEISAGDQKIQTPFAFADAGIFQILDINIMEGEAYNANEPNKCVISQRYAQALFGQKSPIGESISLSGIELVISGIFKENWPRNSSFQFSLLVPQELSGNNLSDWQNGNFYITFALLDNALNFPSFKEKVRNQYKGLVENNLYLEAYKLKDLHLMIEGNQSRVYLLSALALFLLLIACINFVNLATASFTTTALQAGIHKIMGATRIRLIGKYFFNVLLLVILAFAIAIFLAITCLPVFCSLIGQEIQLDDYYNWPTLLLCIGMIAFTTLLSGIYPATFLSSFNPITVLKDKTFKAGKSTFFRNALVSVQFIIAITLIISILTVSKQLNMYNDMDLGYERQEVMYVDLRGTDQGNAFVLKQELLKDPSVIAASACHHLPTTIDWRGNLWDWENMPVDLNAYFYLTHVDSDWPKVMGINMQEGAFFSDNNPGIVINDEAKKVIGWTSCTDKYLGRHNMDTPASFKITGVMDKFLFNNFKMEQAPLVIFPLKENVYDLKPSFLMVRVQGSQLMAMYNLIKDKTKAINGDGNVGFLSQLTQKFLQEEQQMIKIVSLFSVLAIIISCLGLFGMATYIIERKRKEIGIRRVNGAKVSEIIWLLNVSFIRPIAIAFIIACPIAYYLMYHWLEQYVYRTNIGWEIFIITGAITIAIVVLTLTWKSHKAAVENPVNCLRNE